MEYTHTYMILSTLAQYYSVICFSLNISCVSFHVNYIKSLLSIFTLHSILCTIIYLTSFLLVDFQALSSLGLLQIVLQYLSMTFLHTCSVISYDKLLEAEHWFKGYC